MYGKLGCLFLIVILVSNIYEWGKSFARKYYTWVKVSVSDKRSSLLHIMAVKSYEVQGPMLQNNTTVNYRGTYNPTISRVKILW